MKAVMQIVRTNWVYATLIAVWSVAILVSFTRLGADWGYESRGLESVDSACYGELVAGLWSNDQLQGTISSAFSQRGFENCPPAVLESIQSRVSYPVLSLPFVLLLGIDGLLVIPALSLISTVLILAWKVQQTTGQATALVFGGLALTSSSMTTAAFAALPDILLALSLTVILVNFPVSSLRMTWLNYVAIAVATIIGNAAKQSWPFFLVLVIPVLIRIHHRKYGRASRAWCASAALIVSLTASVEVAKRLLANPENGPLAVRAVLDPSNLASVEKVVSSEATYNYLDIVWRMVRWVIWESMIPVIADGGLVVLVLTACASVVVMRKHFYVQVFIALGVTVLVVGSANGSYTNGRFLLPMVPGAVLAGSLLFKAPLGSRQKSTSHGPQPASQHLDRS